MREMATQREQAERLKREILRAWADERTIASISRSTGVGRNAVRALLEAEGVRGARPDAKATERADRRRETLFWVRQHPGSTVAQASTALGLPVRTVVDYLDGTDESALLVETRAKESEFTPASMQRHLREVWDGLPDDDRGTGLSKVRYAALIKEEPDGGASRPSTALFEKRFPSWSAACIAAGVPVGRRTRKTYTRSFSQADMERAIAQFIEETGETSFSAYSAWAKRNAGKPSGSLVITRFGRWSNARRAVAVGGVAA
jgi:hypothetical protein